MLNGEEWHLNTTPTAPPQSESSRSYSQGGGTNPERELARSLGAMSIASTTKQLDGDATPTRNLVSAEEEETAETMEFCRQLREQVETLSFAFMYPLLCRHSHLNCYLCYNV